MAVKLVETYQGYIGLSTDTKPPAPVGAAFYEEDTQKWFIRTTLGWVEDIRSTKLTGSLNKDNLYLLTHELLVNPPPGHLATFGSVAVPAGKVLYISQIYFGGVRTIDHSIAHAYTFSIDGELSLELYNGLYVNCLNLGSPYRMIFNAKGMPAFSTPIIFDRGGLPLYGGNSGSTYYWRIKNEDPLHAMTGNLTIVGQWV